MNTRTTPKDFFVYLGATIALYVSAIALINLAFSVINYSFPDALGGYFSPNSIVWPVSMLIVLIPAFYILEWLINRDLVRFPEKKDIWIRRWRIYLTLFLTGGTIVGDLIALINTYLNGEITSRFTCKVIVVLIVTGVIFAYYLLARADDQLKAKRSQRILSWVGILLVLAGIVGGFAIVGSPAKQRALRFDNQRISELSSIQWQIINYWQQKGILPAALADLNDSISGFSVPIDPDPDAQVGYEYQVKGNRSFELCATFTAPSQDVKGRAGYNYSYAPYPMQGEGESWNHGAGRVCFERTIDPSRYPVTPRKPVI